MNAGLPGIVVAGHICLDIIPGMEAAPGGVESLFVPGKLINAGPAVFATGGAVSNTGLALHKLGAPVDLMGKMGNDPFGKTVLDLLESHGEGLTDCMICGDSDSTSYTLVINPPDLDRIFIHCPGANDTFDADSIDYDKVGESGLFHFGYPPLMRAMYENDGDEMLKVFERVRSAGVTTSLDMALPDPDSPAGKVDWLRFLGRILPHVDVFVPSLDEILFMLRGNEAIGNTISDARLLEDVSSQLVDMGVAVVLIKLGEDGLYLRTTDDTERLASMGRSAPDDLEAWTDRELRTTCFEAEVVGTTGAGDCAVAGFLAGLIRRLAPEDVLSTAAATGACSVEAADATSGIRSWEETQARIRGGWRKR